MPSPFAGMDPLLEDPLHWRGVHTRLMTGITAQLNDSLNDSLPDGFVADVEERGFVTPPARSIFPDVLVAIEPNAPRNSGGVSTLASRSATDSMLLSFASETQTQHYVTIRKLGEPGDVVAVIEVLSPSNKDGAEGSEQYRKKQNEVLYSGAHLLEIDLLRSGRHTLAPPRTLIHPAH